MSDTKEKLELKSADDLRSVTITEQQAFDKQVKDFALGMFQDLHKRATLQGKPSLVAPVNPQADSALLQGVVDIYLDLGYEAEIVEVKEELPTGPEGAMEEHVVSKAIKVSA